MKNNKHIYNEPIGEEAAVFSPEEYYRRKRLPQRKGEATITHHKSEEISNELETKNNEEYSEATRILDHDIDNYNQLETSKHTPADSEEAEVISPEEYERRKRKSSKIQGNIVGNRVTEVNLIDLEERTGSDDYNNESEHQIIIIDEYPTYEKNDTVEAIVSQEEKKEIINKEKNHVDIETATEDKITEEKEITTIKIDIEKDIVVDNTEDLKGLEALEKLIDIYSKRNEG
ncbi:hypothetical protein [Alkaliphilus peptidifermentans]|uniref:Uncharacterized protein n=1 Tax=Alkaliphilus peptidifermentans DSM 18978 TaxID=1120976 RepID=A0A1G5GF42_9FIRM|nr:hypothetical protein [Alkaliphilus peptidifermentans]SCY50196.1 hypothetical protein SAMN03080606_01668 [Alkaliphilus peptidifermentans DSM 18978]